MECNKELEITFRNRARAHLKSIGKLHLKYDEEFPTPTRETEEEIQKLCHQYLNEYTEKNRRLDEFIERRRREREKMDSNNTKSYNNNNNNLLIIGKEEEEEEELLPKKESYAIPLGILRYRGKLG